MDLAQRISSLILSLRKKTRIKVRQPLLRVLIPSLDTAFEEAINDVKSIILSEVNIKSIEFISKNDPLLKKKIETKKEKYEKQKTKTNKILTVTYMAYNAHSHGTL